MIALDEIRSALREQSPASAFDSLVRREMAAGHRVAEIYKSITTHFPEIEEWPEYDGVGYDDLNGTLDKLMGWCHASCRYNDPPAVRPSSTPAADVVQTALSGR
jgi:hypothetical protein